MPSSDNGQTKATPARGPARSPARSRLPRPSNRLLGSLALTALILASGGWAALRHPAAALTPTTPSVAQLRTAVAHANIVLIVIDSARADHLGCYGYPRPTTPTIDRLAAHSITFTNHYCQIPMTAASTASLFTSQFPDTHGIFYQAPADWQPDFTLARALSRAGFRTALFSSNPSASPAVGIGRDFAEAYHRTKPVDQGTSFSPKSLLIQFDTWLRANRRSRFFAYLHLLPPHTPYNQPDRLTRLFDCPPPGYASCDYTPLQCDFPITGPYHRRPHPPLPDWINLYDANLRYADWAIGEIIAKLAAAGLLDATLLLITSDHGEAFGEHGYVWHVGAIHDEAAHIPLLIKFPGDAVTPHRIHSLTQTIDLLPTICDLLAIPYPRDSVQGSSLLPLLAGLADTAAPYTITKSIGPAKYMIRDRDHSLLLYRDREHCALYDLRTDPSQRTDLASQRADCAQRLRRIFRRYARAQRHPPVDFLDPNARPLPDPLPDPAALPPALQRDIKTLGYLH